MFLLIFIGLIKKKSDREKKDVINLATHRGDATPIILYLYLTSISYVTVAFYAVTVAIVYIKSIIQDHPARVGDVHMQTLRGISDCTRQQRNGSRPN
jgi:hypothetical protein